MTEEEWLTCDDPALLMELQRRNPNNPKFRLFGLACCRAIWHLLTEKIWRSGVEMAESYTEGSGSQREMESLCKEIEKSETARFSQLPHGGWHLSVAVAGVLRSGHLLYQAGLVSKAVAHVSGDSVNQIGILHDIYRNPSRHLR
jgi:hypothetical protein